MIQFLCVAVLLSGGMAEEESVVVVDSYSKSVGSGNGTSFATNATDAPIIALKVWSDSYPYIRGFQLRYESGWSDVMGRARGQMHQMKLFEGERIVQLSGQFGDYAINLLIFVTSRGRSLFVGQTSSWYSTSNFFNFYPVHKNAELLMLNGRYDGQCITSIGAYWGMPYTRDINQE